MSAPQATQHNSRANAGTPTERANAAESVVPPKPMAGSAASYSVRTTHRWLMSRSKQWLADEVFYLMNLWEIPHQMRTSEPLKTLFTKDQLARQYRALAADLPDP